MKKEHLIERQGKTFALYSGLLALGHEKGLVGISTELVQVPHENNGKTAIVKATVTMDVDGAVRLFQGYGDAAPNNVAPGMVTCLIRLAETRAKARALRDAVNIGEESFEEQGEEGSAVSSPARTRQRVGAGTAALYTGEGLCPGCNAPTGKAHLPRCTRKEEVAA